MHVADCLRGVCLTVSLLMLCFAGSSGADEIGTLVLKDSTRLEHVKYSVNKTYQIIEYKRADGSEKHNVSFTDIEAILDEDGVNIAPDVLGRWYRPSFSSGALSEENIVRPDSGTGTTLEDASESGGKIPAVNMKPSWRSERDTVHKLARKRLWSVWFRLGGSYGIPAGSWYDDVRSGIGFEGDFTVALNHYIALRFSFARTGLNVDDDFFYLGIPSDMIQQQLSTMRVNRYFASLMYYHRFNRHKGGQVIFHGESGLGAVEHQMETSAMIDDGISVIPVAFDDSQTKFAITLEAGFLFLFSRSLGIDLSLAVDQVAVGRYDEESYWGYNNVAYAYIINIKYGIVALF